MSLALPKTIRDSILWKNCWLSAADGTSWRFEPVLLVGGNWDSMNHMDRWGAVAYTDAPDELLITGLALESWDDHLYWWNYDEQVEVSQLAFSLAFPGPKDVRWTVEHPVGCKHTSAPWFKEAPKPKLRFPVFLSVGVSGASNG